MAILRVAESIALATSGRTRCDNSLFRAAAVPLRDEAEGQRQSGQGSLKQVPGFAASQIPAHSPRDTQGLHDTTQLTFVRRAPHA
jgi:hypothetical protein